jgi:hypothetical protein
MRQERWNRDYLFITLLPSEGVDDQVPLRDLVRLDYYFKRAVLSDASCV